MASARSALLLEPGRSGARIERELAPFFSGVRLPRTMARPDARVIGSSPAHPTGKMRPRSRKASMHHRKCASPVAFSHLLPPQEF